MLGITILWRIVSENYNFGGNYNHKNFWSEWSSYRVENHKITLLRITSDSNSINSSLIHY